MINITNNGQCLVFLFASHSDEIKKYHVISANKEVLTDNVTHFWNNRQHSVPQTSPQRERPYDNNKEGHNREISNINDVLLL